MGDDVEQQVSLSFHTIFADRNRASVQPENRPKGRQRRVRLVRHNALRPRSQIVERSDGKAPKAYPPSRKDGAERSKEVGHNADDQNDGSV